MVLGDFNPISGLSGLSRSDHGHVSVFFSQPSCNTCNFHRGVLVLQQMTSFSGYFWGRRMCRVMKLFFGLSIIKGTTQLGMLGCGRPWSLPSTGPQDGYEGGPGLPSRQRGEPLGLWTLTPTWTPALLFHDFYLLDFMGKSPLLRNV